MGCQNFHSERRYKKGKGRVDAWQLRDDNMRSSYYKNKKTFLGVLILSVVIFFALLSIHIFSNEKRTDTPMPPALINVLEEAENMNESKNPDWWLDSGAYFYYKGNVGRTVRGELPINDPWRVLYAKDNPVDTDNGYHPQNIFRLINKRQWENFEVQTYFTISKINLSKSPERDEWSGLLLFLRYKDADNLYYAGIRADGTAVIKAKKNGTYETLDQRPVFLGTYDRNKNPLLLPENTELGLRADVRTENDGTVSIKLFFDRPDYGWTEIASAKDTEDPILGKEYTGVRTDFMDVSFRDYRVKGI